VETILSILARFRRFRKQLTWRLAWDMFMVYLAIINVSLILFDLTYLWLRPQYFRLLPIVTDVYDPVKGIEPHPLTERYLEIADETDALLPAGVSPVELAPRLSELRELSAQIVTENPFERSGQTRSVIRLQVGAKDYLQREGTLALLPERSPAPAGGQLPPGLRPRWRAGRQVLDDRPSLPPHLCLRVRGALVSVDTPLQPQQLVPVPDPQLVRPVGHHSGKTDAALPALPDRFDLRTAQTE
jgi:hypothetical protein